MTKRFIRIAGALAALSALFWMVTGMGWWAGTNTVPGDFSHAAREAAIFVTHMMLMAFAAISYLE